MDFLGCSNVIELLGMLVHLQSSYQLRVASLMICITTRSHFCLSTTLRLSPWIAPRILFVTLEAIVLGS